ncbi:hypothetical protein NEF87_001046 [Candidatus Lokiarchaeum ossiferum]|uniref:Helicase ATP-binding domain-containing protein n=1 Tax=Candidatus Lokiarchaeum ossiferum TaxID=2951803 RepID=A0ABY6HQD2_9ARCH|nr:hypothetical protein NEF87_001046 [Candidatus Lokiarchaeum sp. B-35]
MVDFTKMLKENKVEKTLDPIQIFNNLDTFQGKEYIRDSQREILKEWNLKNRSNHDVIVKLHTGHGKTLVGLLIIQSKMNELNKPGLFLCPNKYLVDQIFDQAQDFGISVVKAVQGQPLPMDFINSKSILITSVDKLFNGMSLFGIKNNPRKEIMEIGAIVMDDAHKSLAIIRKSFSIQIPKRKEYLPIYHKILRLFESDLIAQNDGLYFDISHDSNKIMQVPYWAWKSHVMRIREILSDYLNLNNIKFSWDLINTTLKDCLCFISGHRIEITPRILPLDMIPSFENANQRIYLSATLTDDVFLIKDFGIDKDAVLNPLTYKEIKYSGERPIIIPSLINSEINRSKLVKWICDFSKNSKGDFGIFSIVPSGNSKSSWEENGAEILFVRDIHNQIVKIKKKIKANDLKKPNVLINQYDGIDLPDNLCRVLVLDLIPEYQTIYDEFLHMILPNSLLMYKNIAQRIEQGIGRGIRGKNDYCLVIILGVKLSRFFLEGKKQAFLSNEVKKQIEIGNSIISNINSAESEEEKLLLHLEGFINQFIERDESWKKYYQQKMEEIEPQPFEESVANDAELERNAYIAYRDNNISLCNDLIDRILLDTNLTSEERGWYFEQMASYKYSESNEDSFLIQQTAHELNPYLSIPPISKKNRIIKLEVRDQAVGIHQFIRTHDSFNDMMVDITALFADLNFGVSASAFEEAIKKLGSMLGFASFRPEKELKDGPDNLWALPNNKIYAIECKNEVIISSQGINKGQVGQMSNSVVWTKKIYSNKEVIPLYIHPKKNYTIQAHPAETEYVIDQIILEQIKKDAKMFYSAFKCANISEISLESVQTKLNQSKINTRTIHSFFSVVK